MPMWCKLPRTRRHIHIPCFRVRVRVRVRGLRVRVRVRVRFRFQVDFNSPPPPFFGPIFDTPCSFFLLLCQACSCANGKQLCAMADPSSFRTGRRRLRYPRSRSHVSGSLLRVSVCWCWCCGGPASVLGRARQRVDGQFTCCASVVVTVAIKGPNQI